MKLSTLVEALEERYPRSLSCAWDNDGLMVCRNHDAAVRRVMLALDATRAAVEAANAASCELLLTHHPLLFRPLRAVVPDSLGGMRTMAALESGVAVLSLHTRLDAAENGVNDALVSRLMLEPCGTFGDTESPTLGRLARRPASMPDDPGEFAACIGRMLGAPHVRRTGSRPPKKIALVGGSGKDFLRAAMEAGADTFITGEIGYNDAVDYAEEGLMILEAGHYYTESPVLDTLAAFCSLYAGAECLRYDSNPSVYH